MAKYKQTTDPLLNACRFHMNCGSSHVIFRQLFKQNLQGHIIMFKIGHQGTGKTLVRKEQLGHGPSGAP